MAAGIKFGSEANYCRLSPTKGPFIEGLPMKGNGRGGQKGKSHL
jgi:hypothetical protein